MATTFRYTIQTGPLQAETVIALLGELPFTGFDHDEHSVNAYVSAERHDEAVAAAAQQVTKRFGLDMSVQEMPDVNYNAQWEASYSPVAVGKFLRVRAPFHEPVEGFTHELVIVPEMSFGTGHHETTYLMSEYLRDYSPSGKTCFDFGTGTGVLAMTAKLAGAARVVATDIDARCIRSARDNAERNRVVLDEVLVGTEESLPHGPFDLILANINRGVLVKSAADLAARLAPSGQLWVSGILASDATVVEDAMRAAGLHSLERRQRGDWLALRYSN